MTASVLQAMNSPLMECDKVVVLMFGCAVFVQEPEVGPDVILVFINAVIELQYSLFSFFNYDLDFF